jgi:HTH-type transcriptional regulator / antitoxin HipB
MTMVTVATLADLGVAVRGARVNAGLTQEALAHQAHVSRPFVSQLERGQGPRAEVGRVLSVIRALNLQVALLPAPARPTFDETLNGLLR